MSSLVIGSGWHPELFRAEIKELVQPFQIERIEDSTRIISIDVNNYDLESSLISKLSRSATLDELLSPSGWINTTEINSEVEGGQRLKLTEQISNWIMLNLSSFERGTVAVRWTSIDGGIDSIESSTIAGDLGYVFVENGWSVDLENPTMELMLVLDGSCGVVCWGIRKIRALPRSGWKDRRATERPFFKPISLDPILAKVIVNLTGIKSGSQEYLCDPMCGTGGILMEAALMDVPYVGIDFDQEMVSGCKTNLEWALRENNEHNSLNIVRYGNATDLSSVLADISHLNITGFAFDPPYGKNSWRSDEGWNLLSSVLHSCNNLVVSKSDIGLLCLLPWPSLNKKNTDSKSNLQSSIMGREWNEINSLFQKSNWKIIDKYSIHVHGSMSRLLIRAINM